MRGPFEDEMLSSGKYGPIMAALPAYEGFVKGTLLGQRGSMTKTQMDLLVGLGFSGKTSMGELAEHLAVSKEQASRAVGPLVKQGYVARARNPENHRVVEVGLTEEGRAFLKTTGAEIDRAIDEKLERLSPEDRERLMEASRTAVQILRKL